MPVCAFEGYCDRQNMTNSKECLAVTGDCDFKRDCSFPETTSCPTCPGKKECHDHYASGEWGDVEFNDP